LDEFGAFLHPVLSSAIISLFKSDENKAKAKLILNTHNALIMTQVGLAREEIILVEKSLSEESIIIPLIRKSVRESEAFEKRYREGFYGAVPIIRKRA
jgi:AAA15 family ATPase/GTPase